MKTILNCLLFLGVIIIPDFGYAQIISVSGYVKNFVTDNIIESATVYENRSGIGTITNKEGYYKLLLKPGKQKLTISNPGYEKFTKEFVLSNDTIIAVVMKPDSFKKLELADGDKIPLEAKLHEKKSTQNK